MVGASVSGENFSQAGQAGQAGQGPAAVGPSPHPDPYRALYGISVAAELVGSAPQNLRLYEARGLISPARSGGGTRRYSDNDLARVREIGRLLDDGLNLAGVAAVLALQAVNRDLQAELDRARGVPEDPPESPDTQP
jgi:hypothetical protein